MLNNNVSYLSKSLSFACWLAFACISHASSGQVPNPPRSCDRLDDGRMNRDTSALDLRRTTAGSIIIKMC